MFASQGPLILGAKHAPSSATHQQVRNFSRRQIAYPSYKAPKLGRTHKKDHRTNLRYQMSLFLGKKNYKGEYLDNKYFHTPKNHQPNYISPRDENGTPLVDFKTGQVKDFLGRIVEDAYPRPKRFTDLFRPFPQNPHCRTNFQLSHKDRDLIYERLEVQNTPTQQVAVDMGIKIPRLEAVVKLKQIEKNWAARKKITPELAQMSKTMYEMFPLFSTEKTKENLSEILVPKKTLLSRFLTIAENEPFGPIEASKIYRLPLAVDLLKKAAEVGEHTEHEIKPEETKKVNNVVMGKGTKRYNFEFTKARVGQVGFRYGKTNRDNRKDRKVDFDASGRRIYALPESG